MSVKKQIAFFIMQVFFCTLCFAQREKIDSLKKILHSLKDSTRVDCLNELSSLYIVAERKDSAEYYSKAGLKEAYKFNYINGIASSILRGAQIVMRFENDFIKSERLATISLSWYEKTANDKGLDDLYFFLWIQSFAQSKYNAAIEYAEKMYKLSEKSAFSERAWEALHMISIVYKESGNYEKSFQYNCQAYQVAFKDYKQVMCLFVFAELYAKMENYAAALNYFRQAFLLDNAESKSIRMRSGWDIWIKMEFAEVFSLTHQFDSAWHYYHLFKPSKENEVYNRIYLVSTGECYFLQKNYKNALQNFSEALVLHKKLNDQNQVMRTLIDIGKTYIDLGNDSNALKYGREALTIALNNKATQFIRDGYEILYSVYNRSQKRDSANFYFRQFIEMRDSVASDQTKAKFAAYDYEQKLALMNKEKQIAEQQLKIHQQKLQHEALEKKILIAGVIALLLLGSFIVRNIILKRRNEKQRLEHELELQQLESDKTRVELQQQASELEMQALRAQMNPHFIFNSLNSINMFILENNKLQASGYLSKFSRLIRLILQNSKEAFIPLENELEALQLYLELEALRFENKFEYKILVADEVDTTLLKVPPLIIQPYAENAIWHGLMHKKEKGHLEIELYLEKEILFCKIIDDGIGRKKAAELKSKSASTHKSMGVKITENRIARMQSNGDQTSVEIRDLVYADGSAAGTEVVLRIPVTN